MARVCGLRGFSARGAAARIGELLEGLDLRVCGLTEEVGVPPRNGDRYSTQGGEDFLHMSHKVPVVHTA